MTNFLSRRSCSFGAIASLLVVGGATVLLSLFVADGQALGRERPNLIIILADDLGYGDLGCFGHPTIRTPHLDRMAAGGMKFTEFYAAAPVCTPSRAALLTGRYAVRSGLTRVLIPSSTGGLPDTEMTLAEVLRGAGYATACIGKWHLGWQPRYLPTRHGFDSYFGIPYSNDMSPATQPGNPVFAEAPPTPLMRDERVTNPDREPDQDLLTRRYTEESVAFIRKNAHKKPFFLYLAHTMPHVPLAAGAGFRGKSPRGLYGDAVEEIDWSVGRILKTLANVGLEKETLVVFTSDNGPWLSKKLAGGSAGPFFEGKVSTWEGGLRVPGIFFWPGRVPAGLTTAAFATTMDLFPTFIRLAQATLPHDREIDGKDLSPVLLHGQPGREPLFHYYFNDQLWGVRKGPWKIHFKTTRPEKVTVWGRWEIEEHDPPLLFNLEEDPGEHHDRAAEHPELLADLTALTRRHLESLQPAQIQN